MSALIIGTSPLSDHLAGVAIIEATRDEIFERVRKADRIFHLAPSKLELTQNILDACEELDRPLLLACLAKLPLFLPELSLQLLDRGRVALACPRGRHCGLHGRHPIVKAQQGVQRPAYTTLCYATL